MALAIKTIATGELFAVTKKEAAAWNSLDLDQDEIRAFRAAQSAARYRGFKLSLPEPILVSCEGIEHEIPMFVLRDERTWDAPRPRVFYYATFGSVKRSFGDDMAGEIAPETWDRLAR